MAAPLNRTWYDSLVDDDGSGTTGTIWNKAAVDGLLDSVDASLAPVVTRSGGPSSDQLALFHSSDAIKGSPRITADDANGGILLDGPGYVYLQLRDTTRPANDRVVRLFNAGGALYVRALDDAGGESAAAVIFHRDGRLTLQRGQVTFPTGQISSADPYTFDDYREGVWTPGWGGTGGQSGQTYSVQDGQYTKFGRAVFCTGRMYLTGAGTINGNPVITGLPFPALGSFTPGALTVAGGSLGIPFASLAGKVYGQSCEVAYTPPGGLAYYALLPGSALTAGLDFFFQLVYHAAQ